MKNKAIYLFLFLGLSFLETQAQEAVLSTRGDASGSGGSSSYSVGQVFYKTTIGSSGSLAQGVQQPFEISQVLGVEDIVGINLSLMAYPNPTNNFLNLSIKNYDLNNLSYQLYDLTGRLLINKKLTNNNTNIVMSHYPSAMYYLKVIDHQKLIKTFKIIKK